MEDPDTTAKIIQSTESKIQLAEERVARLENLLVQASAKGWLQIMLQLETQLVLGRNHLVYLESKLQRLRQGRR